MSVFTDPGCGKVLKQQCRADAIFTGTDKLAAPPLSLSADLYGHSDGHQNAAAEITPSGSISASFLHARGYVL